MKEDELHGPQELKNDKFNVDENNPEKQKCVTKMFRETMRQYQMNRLKYHFALIDCDSVETASAIYEGCDGFEFESSGSFVDLRFVPDEMTFDDEPTDVSEEVDAASFKPKYFTTAALRQSRVELTWDEGDHDRVQALTRKKFSQDEILDMDVKAYLASSSSEEDDLAEDLMVKDNVVHEEGTQSSVETKMCEADVINKYRELLKSIQEEDEKKEQNDMEMEITWVPGLKENAKEMVKKNMEAKKKVIPQLKYLEKQKQERKQRVKEKKKMAKGTQVEVGSDDDLPLGVDLNDEFHAEEQQKTGMKSLKEKSTKKDECDSGVTLEEQAENDKQNALLSLLMMDEEVDDRTHFDYDSIVNQQNLTKRKRKMLLKKNNKLMEDDFQVDVQDPRFSALYSSHLFNLDPTNPSFRRTKATEALAQEKAQRRCLEQQPVIPKPGCSANATFERTTSEVTKKHTDSSLALLVKSVKAKAQQHHASKRPKRK
uniref:ESF1 homolog isoform X1 n=1 Tax=Myxine glutinosa TaxID=7769 RepID=UPI00358E6636